MNVLKRVKTFLKKVEFSKLLCGIIAAVIGAVAVYAILRYNSLTKLAIETGATTLPDAALPVACVSLLLASFLSYCLYQFGLKNSRNKYGVDEHGQPYRQKIEDYVDQYVEQTKTEDMTNEYNHYY